MKREINILFLLLLLVLPLTFVSGNSTSKITGSVEIDDSMFQIMEAEQKVIAYDEKVYSSITNREFSVKYIDKKIGDTIIRIFEPRISGNTIDVISENGLIEENETIHVRHLNDRTGQSKDIEIKASPDDAIELARKKLNVKKVSEVRLQEYGTRAVYTVTAEKKEKLFLFIEKESEMTVKIDVNTLEVVNVERPWWGFLAKDISSK